MKIDPYAYNQNGSNALHVAVKLGHVPIVREILKIKNFPVDAMKQNGVTAMGIAAYKGNVIMMEILKEKSNLMFTNANGIGPLYLAIKG
jgi:ankyrin repeat protein